MGFSIQNVKSASKQVIKAKNDWAMSSVLNRFNMAASVIHNQLGFVEGEQVTLSFITDSSAVGITDKIAIHRGCAKNSAKASRTINEKKEQTDTYSFAFPQIWSTLQQYGQFVTNDTGKYCKLSDEANTTCFEPMAQAELNLKGLTVDGSGKYAAKASLKQAVDENGNLLWTRADGELVITIDGELFTEVEGEWVAYPADAPKFPVLTFDMLMFKSHTKKQIKKVSEDTTDTIAEGALIPDAGSELAELDEEDEDDDDDNA